ncbi:MAG TPA: 5-oxoprolinase subunit PxpA [Mycobacteriales bacterium]|nr:5-oxoprolinase subunit PxpA [Mycobacteriales bacterium]
MSDPTGSTTTASVSLTTDIGEGFGKWALADDDALLKIVTSANVACGFHAGDPDIMRRTCQTAAANGVAVGAQVSYRDLAGFGRRYLAIPRESLVNDLLYQIGALDGFARAAGIRVTYVRAHGALYNVAANDTEHAAALVEATRLFDPSLPVLCQPGTAVWELAGRAGITAVAEGFVDRAYTAEGLLVPRSHRDALVTDPRVAAERAVRMVVDGRVTSLDGVTVAIQPRSLLVHCDTPGAVAIALAARDALLAAGVRLVPQS